MPSRLDLMHPGLRNQVLANFASVRAFASGGELNEFVYGMDPEAFAVAAYRTYRQGGGSKFISELLTRAAQGWEAPPSLPREPPGGPITFGPNLKLPAPPDRHRN